MFIRFGTGPKATDRRYFVVLAVLLVLGGARGAYVRDGGAQACGVNWATARHPAQLYSAVHRARACPSVVMGGKFSRSRSPQATTKDLPLDEGGVTLSNQAVSPQWQRWRDIISAAITMYMVAGCTELSNASASKDQIASRLPSEASNGMRRILSGPPSRITAPNPPGRPHDAAGPDIVNPTAAGAAANPSYVRQDRSGCYFCIRDAKGTKLRSSKAVPTPMVCGKFQLDLSTFKIGPKSGSTHPTAGAAAAEPTRHQDQTGCAFSIRHADNTKLRDPKAVSAPKGCRKFQPDLGTLKNGPKSVPRMGLARRASRTRRSRNAKSFRTASSPVPAAP